MDHPSLLLVFVVHSRPRQTPAALQPRPAQHGARRTVTICGGSQQDLHSLADPVAPLAGVRHALCDCGGRLCQPTRHSSGRRKSLARHLPELRVLLHTGHGARVADAACAEMLLTKGTPLPDAAAASQCRVSDQVSEGCKAIGVQRKAPAAQPMPVHGQGLQRSEDGCKPVSGR